MNDGILPPQFNIPTNNGTGNTPNIPGKDERQFFIDNVARFCDKCGSKYNLNDVRIVRDSEFSSIIHFACPNCKSNHIATFIKPMGMSSRTPVNTDLNVDEIAPFSRLDKVSSDEVLDLYNALENTSSVVI